MNFNSEKGLHKQVILVIILGFLTSIFLSFPLWFPYQNTFSPTPIFTFLDFIPELIHSIISSLFIFFLILSLISKKYQKINLLLFGIFFVISLALDQLRWQPWAYYYFLFILAFLFISSIKKEKQLNTIRIILALIYFWSGIQKLNFTFFYSTYPWLIEPITNLLSQNLKEVFNSTFLIAPLVELISGFGLLFKKTQRFSAFTLILMHFFILTMIGPFGHNSNFIVWPWNITFSVLLYLLFMKATKFSILDTIKERVHLYQVSILIIFGILPSLSFFDSWPMFFSSALYSGNKIESKVYITDEYKESLDESIKIKVNNHENSIRLLFLVEEEVKVAIYPTKKFHLNMFKKLCDKFPEYSTEFVLVNSSKPNPITGEKNNETYFCNEIN